MKGLAICAMAALVTACATPTLTYNRIDPAREGSIGNNIEGDTVIALPMVYLEITPKPATATGQSTDAPTFTQYYVENPRATFTVEPQDNFFALTEIAPTYRASVAHLSAIGVRTYDRSADAAQTAASIIALGGDPTFLPPTSGDSTRGAQAAASIGCRGLRPEWISFITASDTREFARRHWEPARCFIEAHVSDLPVDAVSITDFDARWDGKEAHFIISPACRQVTLDYVVGATSLGDDAPPDAATANPRPDPSDLTFARGTQQFRWTGYLPDPNFLRLSPLPRHGTLKMAEACSMPSVERGDSAPPTMAGWLSGLLKPFRN